MQARHCDQNQEDEEETGGESIVLITRAAAMMDNHRNASVQWSADAQHRVVAFQRAWRQRRRPLANGGLCDGEAHAPFRTKNLTPIFDQRKNRLLLQSQMQAAGGGTRQVHSDSFVF
jgi:hypothetical protein